MANDEDFDLVEDQPVAAGSLAPDAVRKIKTGQVLPMNSNFAKSSLGSGRLAKHNGKTVVRPTTDRMKYNAEMQAAEVRFVEEDEIVKAARNKANAPDMLRLLLIQAAQNAASLTFQRIELQKKGDDATQLISRHTKTLKEIAALQAELRELGQQTLDPRSEGFQKVFKLWVEKIQEVISEVLSPEQSDLFFTKFGTVMDNWEEQAENILR